MFVTVLSNSNCGNFTWINFKTLPPTCYLYRSVSYLRPAIYTGQFLASDLLSIQVSLPPTCYLCRSVSYLRPAIYTGHFIASDLLSIQVSFCLRPAIYTDEFLASTCYLYMSFFCIQPAIYTGKFLPPTATKTGQFPPTSDMLLTGHFKHCLWSPIYAGLKPCLRLAVIQ